MKIIAKDNWGSENVSDKLICENINKFYGKIITRFLNQEFAGEETGVVYKLVPDDYKLYKFIA